MCVLSMKRDGLWWIIERRSERMADGWQEMLWVLNSSSSWARAASACSSETVLSLKRRRLPSLWGSSGMIYFSGYWGRDGSRKKCPSDGKTYHSFPSSVKSSSTVCPSRAYVLSVAKSPVIPTDPPSEDAVAPKTFTPTNSLNNLSFIFPPPPTGCRSNMSWRDRYGWNCNLYDRRTHYCN